MNLKKKVCAIALAGAVAVSALSLGFAAWHTDITAGGSASAQGSWELTLTGASLATSQVGAEITPIYTEPEGGYQFYHPGYPATDYSLYNLGRDVSAAKGDPDLPLGEKLDTLLVDRTNTTGTSNTRPWLFALDTTKYTWEDITSIRNDVDAFNVIKYDETSVDLDRLMYVYNNPTSGREGYISVGELFLEDATALLKELHPDTYQNYMIVSLFSDKSGMGAMADLVAYMSDPQENNVVISGTTATFANVDFSLPGAWANYTLTVTNNGTVDAYLKDTVFTLESENDQLVLDTPDLSDEVIAPGESCTLNVVVKAADIESGALEDTGTLSITLPYSQADVGTAPEAGHTHG